MDQHVFQAKHNDGGRLAKIRICLLVAFSIIAGLIAVHYFYKKIYPRLIMPIYSPFAPGAGEKQSVPPLVLEVSRLAAKHNLRQLSISKELLAKSGADIRSFLYHEFLYPIRIVSDSDYIFALAHENIPARDCRAEISGEIAFYDCHLK